MGTINVSLPSDGTTADAADINTPINTIVSEFNGNIENANIKAGAAIATAKLASDEGIVTGMLADASVTPDKIDLDPQTDTVASAETTTSDFPVDLSTSGPAVTVTIGANGLALVMLYCGLYSSAETVLGRMGYAVSGANTSAASSAKALSGGRVGGAGTVGGSTLPFHYSATFLETGLTPGSTTFTAKYGEEGGGTAAFLQRKIVVIPL